MIFELPFPAENMTASSWMLIVSGYSSNHTLSKSATPLATDVIHCTDQLPKVALG